MLEFIVRESIEIPHSPKKVWAALTDPKMIRKYFFGTEVVSTWKPGSPIVFRGVWEGRAYEDKGRILEVKEGIFLKYNYWSSMSGTPDTSSNYSNITYLLAPSEKGTLLTITQDNCKTAAARDHSASNWRMIIGNLSDLLSKARKTAPVN